MLIFNSGLTSQAQDEWLILDGDMDATTTDNSLLLSKNTDTGTMRMHTTHAVQNKQT